MRVDILKDCLVGSHIYAAGQEDVELPDGLVERHTKAGSVIPSAVRQAIESRPIERAVIEADHETADNSPGKRHRKVS